MYKLIFISQVSNPRGDVLWSSDNGNNADFAVVADTVGKYSVCVRDRSQMGGAPSVPLLCYLLVVVFFFSPFLSNLLSTMSTHLWSERKEFSSSVQLHELIYRCFRLCHHRLPDWCWCRWLWGHGHERFGSEWSEEWLLGWRDVEDDIAKHSRWI